jgi:hypothetical protein
MKSSLLTLLGASVIWVFEASAQTLISRFSFELVTPASTTGQAAGPFNADFGPGTVSGFHASAVTSYSTPIGNGSANAFSADHWGIGDYFQFSISTVGFNNLFLTFATERSGSGPTTLQLSYSTDGGANFSLAGLPLTVSSASFSSATYNASFVSTFDLSAITSLNNNAAVVFRLNSSVTGSPTGTARVDDFILSSGGPLTVPEPATIGLFAGGGVMLATAWWRRRR